MKNLVIIFCSVVLSTLMSCDDAVVIASVDLNEQRTEDIAIIEAYLIEKGYSSDQIDTTASGVRYVIIDEGMTQFDSLDIDESDIVDFDYIGRLANDILFDTSIKNIAETSDDVFNEDRNYTPITITYTSSGWTIAGRFVTGFSDGITAVLGKLHVGGRALIVMPSDLGYASQPQFSNGVETIPAWSVLTFEITPTAIDKQ